MESQLTHPGKGAYPMLLVNGERDTQQPIAGLYLIMKHGDPKNAWVNSQGGHMGRSEDWTSREIFQRVVLPWIVRTINAPREAAKKADGVLGRGV